MHFHQQVLAEIFFFKKPPGSGQCAAFAFVPAAATLAGALEVMDLVPASRSAPMALATLGVSSFSGLGKFCFGS